jgi:dipeptidyl aminopeptidase/acylaminoacyl peptidase
VAGITQSIAWSPDGTQLAFAGQMDGLSSDLYLYDLGSQAIQRLSSGPQEVEWIDWSPDGKWILDGSSYFVGEGMTYDVYATSRDGKVSRKLLTDYRMGSGVTWLNGSEFLTYQSENGPGNYGLVRVNIETGRVDKIWDTPFNTFLSDPQGDWLVVRPQSGNELNLVNLTTLQQELVTLPGPVHAVSDLIAMASGADRHFLLKLDNGLDWYYLSTSGALTAAGINADRVSIAPDQQHWITMKADIQLFSNTGTRTRIFALPPGMQAGDFREIIWRPDSSGIFLVTTSSQLYALDYTTGEYELVEQHLATAGPAGLIWVR